MSLDIIEIAVDSITEPFKFEKLASEIMSNEGYPNIKPLGGVHDSGKDAEDIFFLSEGRTRIVFQYTLDGYLSGKTEETIKKLEKAKIEYSGLVIVTPQSISTERQDNIKKDAMIKHQVKVEIYERKTIVNRLAKENGIFNRHFENIIAQLKDIEMKPTLDSGLEDEDKKALEMAMLKVSITFGYADKAIKARRAIFDNLTLAIIISQYPNEIDVKNISKSYPNFEPDYSQIDASLKRLASTNLIIKKNNLVKATDETNKMIAHAIKKANTSTTALVFDIIDRVEIEYRKKLTAEQINIIERNFKNVLIILYRLMGIEISNQVLKDKIPSPVFFESTKALVQTARKDLNKEIGILLLDTIADLFKNPTVEHAEILANWSYAFIGTQVMNLDPTLNEFQITNLSKKGFILDTDFLLDCIVQECPLSVIYNKLLRTIIKSGCKVIIPKAVIFECITHAKFAHRPYNVFKETLFNFDSAYIDSFVRNVFVKGFYYGIANGNLPINFTFVEYLSNYFDEDRPFEYFLEIISNNLPKEITIQNPSELLKSELPEKLFNVMTDHLYDNIIHTKKAEYRSSEENIELARTDARLFLATLFLSGESEHPTGKILGGKFYLVTSSSRYLKCAKEIGIRDVVTTRPQSLISLFNLVDYMAITPQEYIQLFENPLLIFAVSQSKDDVKALVSSGIDLKGKNIPRLRKDLSEALHSCISQSAIEDRIIDREEIDSSSNSEKITNNYIQLIEIARERGYKLIPEIESLVNELNLALKEKHHSKEQYVDLEKRFNLLKDEYKKIVKRKSRFLKMIERKN